MADYWDFEVDGEVFDEGSEPVSNAQDLGGNDAASKPLTLAELEGLGAKGGRWGELWQELAEARRVREAQSARTALQMHAEALAESDEAPDFSQEEVREAFRERERARAAAVQAEVDRKRLEALIDGLGEELGRGTFEAERKERNAVGSWLMDGSDPLYNSPEFLAWEKARAEELRALRLASDQLLPSLDEVVQEARAGIRETLELVITKAAK